MRAIVLLIALAVAGCAFGGDESDSAATLETRDLPRLVLLPRDLPRGFTRFDWGRQITADRPPGTRSDPQRFGRIDGWKARYTRSGGTTQTPGPLVIESRVDLFENEGGAEDELAAHRSEVEGSQVFLNAQPLGDESFFSTPRGEPAAVRYYLVAWRIDNAAASLLVSGFARRLTRDDALAIARRQERRMTAAAR